MTPEDLRKRRKAAGYRLRSAALRCRVPERTWGSWERGEYPIPGHAETLLELLELLQKDHQSVNPVSTPFDPFRD
jgi:transcriptional regulator with XRE-family HTH domain